MDLGWDLKNKKVQSLKTPEPTVELKDQDYEELENQELGGETFRDKGIHDNGFLSN